MSENLLTRYVPPGTVCIQCSVGDEVANDSIFQIAGSDIDASTGRVVDGVLVVFDTESVFGTSSATDVQCMSVNLNASHSVKTYLECKSQLHIYWELCFHDIRALILVFRPPVITGNTTLNEGDTLDLNCVTSNSNPRVGLKWLSPEGVVLSNKRTLEIMNIQGSAAGTYTCAAIRFITGATINSTAVNVTVQCKCQVKHVRVLILHIHINQIVSSIVCCEAIGRWYT